MRILDLIEFQPDKFQKRHEELKFCQYYRKVGSRDGDWIFGQGVGHMSVKTFYKLIRKAMNSPAFKGVFDNVGMHKRDRRQKTL